MSSYLWRSVLVLTLDVATCYYIMPDLDDVVYAETGDVNLGAIVSVTDYDVNVTCYERVTNLAVLQVIESLVLAVQQINKEGVLLPGLRLGFVITDSCHKEKVAAMQALRFTLTSNEEDYLTPNDTNYLQAYKVVGVISAPRSAVSMTAAQVLNTAKISMLAYWAYDNRLRDMSLFPNLYSIVAPEVYLLHAVLSYLEFNEWTHFSLIYDDHSNSENLVRELLNIMTFSTFCLGQKLRVSEEANLTLVMDTLMTNANQTVIVLILGGSEFSQELSRLVKERDLEGKLLWIGLDLWTDFMFTSDAPIGSIGIHSYAIHVKGLMEHMSDVKQLSENPWLVPTLKTAGKCFDNECIRSFVNTHFKEPSMAANLIHSATNVFARALSRQLHLHCMNVTRATAYDCLMAHISTVPESLMSVDIPGYDSNVKINTRGFVPGSSYIVYQKTSPRQRPRTVAKVSIYNQAVKVIDNIDWSVYSFSLNTLNPRHCMPKCGYNEYKYETRCCWVCLKCQESERLNENSRICEDCPLLHWPQLLEDGGEYAECILITPSHYEWSKPLPATLIGLAMFGVVICLSVLYLYLTNKFHPVIKAASIEISCVQLASCILGFFAVPIFLMKPNELSCKVSLFLFRFSCNILFLTMLIKAFRVYRIFQLSKKNKKLSYTGTRFLLLICGGHFFLEIGELSISNHYYPLTVEITQPEKLVKYTEFSCKFEKAHLLPFFIFDFFLLIMCSLFAFKTQTLPKNFRESRFVSMCIITTLILWIAFMPAYMTLNSNNSKALLLVCAILINQTNHIIFIFITRIIAWKYSIKKRNSIFLTTGM